MTSSLFFFHADSISLKFFTGLITNSPPWTILIFKLSILSNGSSNKPSNYTGFAFLSFDSSNEILDIPSNAGISSTAPIYVNGGLFADSFNDLIDGGLGYRNYSVLSGLDSYFWSFSDSTGALDGASCNGGTSNSSGVQGNLGRMRSTGTTWLDHSTNNCNQANRYLLCIAKPN